MGVGVNPPLAVEPSPPAAPAGPSSVLVVDDNEANRDALSRRLVRRGYTVAVARDGPEALAQVAQRKFDLVLLDVMMPGMSGLEVLEHLRLTHAPADLPVIMATAKDQSEDIVNALNLGANDYVTKPLDFPVVLARVRTQLALKHSVEQIRELERRLSQRNVELEAAAERTRRDLQAAAMIQESYLPKSAPDGGGMRFAWKFQPCEALAGDSLNVCPLDEEHVGAYVLDVSGHGVASALLSVAATRALSPASDPHSLLVHRAGAEGGGSPVPPAEVADRLNRKFTWDAATQQFLTIFYVVVNVKSGQCRYVSAGHPGAIHLTEGSTPLIVEGEGTGLPIGIGESYEEYGLNLQRGDRLYLYSDGVTEAMSPEREMFGRTRLMQILDRWRSLRLDESVTLLVKEVGRWCAAPARDDISVLAIERE